MRVRAIYGQYRQALCTLAEGAAENACWQQELNKILERLEVELTELEPTSAAVVQRDLCEQLELLGYGAATPERRTALFAALKRIELLD